MASHFSKQFPESWGRIRAAFFREENMKIGCPREIKPQEFRVGMTPTAAHEAVTNGHEV